MGDSPGQATVPRVLNSSAPAPALPSPRPGVQTPRRRLPDAELELLPDAMRFRGLLYGTGHLTETVERGMEELPQTWCWERHEVADKVALRVGARIEAQG